MLCYLRTNSSTFIVQNLILFCIHQSIFLLVLDTIHGFWKSPDASCSSLYSPEPCWSPRTLLVAPDFVSVFTRIGSGEQRKHMKCYAHLCRPFFLHSEVQPPSAATNIIIPFNSEARTSRYICWGSAASYNQNKILLFFWFLFPKSGFFCLNQKNKVSQKWVVFYKPPKKGSKKWVVFYFLFLFFVITKTSLTLVYCCRRRRLLCPVLLLSHNWYHYLRFLWTALSLLSSSPNKIPHIFLAKRRADNTLVSTLSCIKTPKLPWK